MQSDVSKKISDSLPLVILGALSLFLLWWFRVYLTDENIASVDLPSHISLVRSMKEQLVQGRISFYDHTTFTGFPAFRFYGFVPALCTALLAFPLDLFGYDGARLATHLLLLVGVALFPFSFYFCARPLAVELVGGEGAFRDRRFGFAAMVAAFSFWFLNHDKQWFGIGAAAPMNIGLFAQLFGWHLLLLYLGSLLRLQGERGRTAVPMVAVWYALLPLTHTVTFIHATYLGAMYFLFFGALRTRILSSHLLGCMLAGFWLIPMVVLVGTYTAYDVSRPTGDFLEIFFRYPWYGLWRTGWSFLQGGEGSLELLRLLLLPLTGILLAHHRVRKDGRPFLLFVIVTLGILLSSSGFVATSIPLGLHYYRFFAGHFLVLAVLFSALPLVLGAGSTKRGLIEGLLCLVAILSLASSIALPHAERDMIRAHVGTSYLDDEEQVLAHFRRLPMKGRVYVEYLKDYRRFPQLSAHYLSSRLPTETGFESVVSSHLQESLAYRMIAGTANLLKAQTYNVPLLFTERADLEGADLIAQLSEFGITHVVCGRKVFCSTLEGILGREGIRIGRYRIFELSSEPLRKVEAVSKQLIGYVDQRGTLPFHLLQYYFYARADLFQSVQLIELNSVQNPPPGVAALVVNVGPTWRTEAIEGLIKNTLPIEFDRSPAILNHYAPHYPHNIEFDHYREIEVFLDQRELTNALTTLIGQSQASKVDRIPKFVWGNGGQSFEVSDLVPGRFYRVNYSYFPYWKLTGGELFRGSGERIYFLAESERVEGRYSAWGMRSSWFGLGMTLLGLVVLFRIVLQRR
jgi:hypothetical protein